MNDCQRQIKVEKNIETHKRVVPPQPEISAENLMDIQSALDQEWMSSNFVDLQNKPTSDKIIRDTDDNFTGDL